jgi:hypothetical protein
MHKTVGWKPKSSISDVASVRFRCLSPMNELKRMGFDVQLYSEEAANAGQYSAVIFSKLYAPADQALAKRLKAEGVKTLLDLSDNHFYNPAGLPEYLAAASNMKAMSELVDRVICCSPHLALIVSQQAKLRRSPLVVGDAVEQMSLPVDAVSPFVGPQTDVFRILWFGSHGSPNAPAGMEDILRIREHLEALQGKVDAELVILSNNVEKYRALSSKIGIASTYVEWAGDVLVKLLAKTNLVVIPITENPFTKCKSNNRAATALWHGIPVIADRIPAYESLRSFLFLDDWRAGFDHAVARSREIQLRTSAGAAYVRQNFNISTIAGDWRRAITTVLADPVLGP